MLLFSAPERQLLLSSHSMRGQSSEKHGIEDSRITGWFTPESTDMEIASLQSGTARQRNEQACFSPVEEKTNRVWRGEAEEAESLHQEETAGLTDPPCPLLRAGRQNGGFPNMAGGDELMKAPRCRGGKKTKPWGPFSDAAGFRGPLAG